MPRYGLWPMRFGLFQQLTELCFRGGHGPVLRVFHVMALHNHTNVTIIVINGADVNGHCVPPSLRAAAGFGCVTLYAGSLPRLKAI